MAKSDTAELRARVPPLLRKYGKSSVREYLVMTFTTLGTPSEKSLRRNPDYMKCDGHYLKRRLCSLVEE